MKTEIHLHNAKPTVWQGDSGVIGIWFNENSVEITAFINSPEDAIEAGKKLIEAGKRAQLIQQIKTTPVDIGE